MQPEEKFHEHHNKLIDRYNERYESARRDSERLSDLIEFLRDELLPHAEAEEKELYSAVDELDQGMLATESMRTDHRMLKERIETLAVGDYESEDDLRRQLDEFSAILLNHFHKEEEILIPFLNEKTETQEFEDLLGHVHEAEEQLNQANNSRG